jgi:signal-transduction protein with cAMP-binding, CBS, and nucleotidyltransferase domain
MEHTVRPLYPNLEFLGPATGFVDEIVDIIGFVPLFEGLDREEVWEITRFMSCYGAPKDETLLREGEPGDYLLLLLTGEVDVWKRDANGQDKKIAVVAPGTTLGEMSLIDGRPRFATCITSMPVDFAVLHRDGLNDLLNETPRLAAKFTLLLLQMMTRRLRDTSNRLLHLAVAPLV